MALTREGPEIFRSPFLRSSSSTLLRSFTISWSLLILGLPLPGEALPPISLRS